MTTEELKLSEVTWGDKHRIRMIEIKGIQYVPVTDIAKAVGVRKRAFLTLLDNNPDVFSQHERSADISTPGGIQRTRCINLIGAYGMLTRVSTNHIKNPDTRKNLIEFNRWAMAKAVGSPAPYLALPAGKDEPDYDSALRAARFAKELSVITGTDPLPLICQALDHHALGIYGGLLVPMVEQKALPAPEKKPKDYLTATDIGNHPKVQKSAHEVYMMLYQRKPPLVVKDQKDEWRLTEHGREYGGEECREIAGGFFVWRIHWRKEIMTLFNVHEEME